MALIFTISREALLSALTPLLNIAGKKGSMAILSNVLIETEDNAVFFTGTDLETGIRIKKAAEISSSGAITLPARKLFEITREAEANFLRFEEKEKSWMKIISGSAVYNISGIENSEYPAFPEYKEEELYLFDSEILKELIDKTSISIATEKETQFNMTGFLIENEKDKTGTNNIRMITSDGHRLSIAEKIVEETVEINKRLVPKKGVIEIRRLCDQYKEIQVGFNKNQALIKTKDTIMVVRLMNGEFPDYRTLTENFIRENEIKINRISLLNSLKRINLLSEDKYHTVHFDIDENKLFISSQSADIGSATEEIETEYKYQKMKLGFNARFFIETLQVMKSEMVKIYIVKEESPCYVCGDEDQGFISIIMPMKL